MFDLPVRSLHLFSYDVAERLILDVFCSVSKGMALNFVLDQCYHGLVGFLVKHVI
jgi:hypothetical protein